MRIKRLLFLSVCACVVVVGLAGFVVASLYFGFGNISPQKAQEICNTHAQKASAEITRLQGYTLQNSASSCIPRVDEMGSDDYGVGSSFLLTKQAIDSRKPTVTKADIEHLQRELHIIQEGWSIRNIIDSDGQSYKICASAGAYLDNDGKYYSQGNTSNSGHFYTSVTEPGYSESCL